MHKDVQDNDISISFPVPFYVTVNSQKDNGKALKHHIFKGIAVQISM